MTQMIADVFIVTRAELALFLLSGFVLVQVFVYRAHVMQAMAKQNAPHFPGLSEALADIPARVALRAKQRDS